MSDTTNNINSSPTPSQNSGAINTLSIILIVMLVLIAGLFYINFQSSGNSNSSSTKEQNLTEEQRIREEIVAMENQLRAQGKPIPVDTSSVQELSSRISRDAISLKSAMGRLQQTLSDKEATLNRLQTDFDAVKTINERNGAEATKLREQISKLQAQSGNATYLQQQVQSLNATIIEKDKQLANYLNRPSNEQLASVRKSFAAAMGKNKELQTSLTRLQAETQNMISEAEARRMKSQLERLIPENQRLRVLVQQLRSEQDFSKLYVKSADQLMPKAAKLFRELQLLEGQSPNQLQAAYTRIGEQLNAHIVQKVNFRTGSSDVDFADQSTIKDKLNATPPNSFFLVVGYASQTGGAKANETLSAKRAATSASVVNQLLKQGQDVRAVYLGQTDRFAENAAQNQICEIWEIRK